MNVKHIFMHWQIQELLSSRQKQERERRTTRVDQTFFFSKKLPYAKKRKDKEVSPFSGGGRVGGRQRGRREGRSAPSDTSAVTAVRVMAFPPAQRLSDGAWSPPRTVRQPPPRVRFKDKSVAPPAPSTGLSTRTRSIALATGTTQAEIYACGGAHRTPSAGATAQFLLMVRPSGKALHDDREP